MLKRFAFPLTALLSLSCLFLNPTPTPAPTSPSQATPVPQTPPTSLPPTDSSAPTSTPQVVVFPTPDVPLSRTGPWLLATDDNGLWAVNSDGTGLTQLFDKKAISSWYDLSPAISPDGHHVAFVTADDPQRYTGLRLVLLTMPEGTIQTITPLLKPNVEPFADFSDPIFEAARSIIEYPSIAWSPDGRKLAFISAHDGPSSDLYLYSLDDQSITRLNDGPSQTYGLSWSPDGKYIVHVGVESFGTGAGASLVGMWAARADGSGVKTLYTPTGGDERVIGWVAPDTMIVEGWNALCGNSNIRLYNIETGAETLLREDCYNHIAFDPSSHAFMFAVDSSMSDFLDDKRTGAFLWSPGMAEPAQVDENGYYVEWSPEAGLFFTASNEGLAAYDARGAPAAVPPGITDPPAASNAGDFAWIDDNFALQVADSSGQIRAVFDGAGGPIVWSADGQSLFFTDDRAALVVAHKPDFTAEKIADFSNAGDMVWLGPQP